jgi:maltose/moltooligosaccharide transporter
VNHLPPPITDATGAGPNKVYHVGTLSYTKPALAMLLVWLFWGDFCYMMMEAVTTPIMQFKFKDFDASNIEIGLLITTIPTGVYSFLNPIISFKSDRFRSRWGRRIPFIAGSLPFLVGFLVLLAFGDEIGHWIYRHLGPWVKHLSVDQTMIYTYGVLLALFTVFNTFVTSTFWYLFNDVVPEHLLARFMSWFRFLALMSGALYNWVIFPYSETHATEIFLGAAALYLAGFSLMCFNVKEGQYPPPPPYVDGETGPIAAIKTYAKETHAFPHYWYLWLCTFIGSIGGGVGTFTLYFLLALGLNPGQIGPLNSVLGLVAGLLILGTGWMADRFHPIRVVVAGVTLSLFIVTPLGLVWLFWHPSPTVVFWVMMALNLVLVAPSQALTGMWDPPMLMRLFPRSHFGQFCSINAVWRAVGGVLGGVLTGVYLQVIARWVGKENEYYYLPFWSLCFGLPSYYLLIRLYWSWKKHGGDAAYVAPVLETSRVFAPSANAPVLQEMEN